MVFRGVVLPNLLFSVRCFIDHCLSFFLLFPLVLSAIQFSVSDYPFNMFQFSDNLLVSEIGNDKSINEMIGCVLRNIQLHISYIFGTRMGSTLYRN
jgi:hypothetical protein